MDSEWALLGAAAFVGVLVGITGVGAGAIMTPLLVAVFGVPISTAVATDLVFATITKIFGVGLHHRTGNINWKTAGRLWSGSIPGVVVGVAILIIFAAQDLGQWLLWPLVFLVLATAFTLGSRALKREIVVTPKIQESRDHEMKRTARYAPLGGFGIGLAVALTSVGAGALGMALLVKLSPRDTKPQHLVGTDLVHAIPIALIAGAAYGLAGLISWPLLTVLLLGSIPGVVLGSFFSNRLPSKPLNLLLALVLVVAAILVAVKAL
jgi:uncharacterized protein